MAARASRVYHPVSRAAEMLGEDEQLLWDLADPDMDPEDGCLWIYRTDDQQTIAAFTPVGMEYLRELLAEHKRNRSSPRC